MSINALASRHLHRFALGALVKTVRAWQCFHLHGLEISLRDQVTAKTAKIRNNYMPRFVFYPKIRLLFIENRLLHRIRKSASLVKHEF
jgi:hypothetical protein